MSTLEKEFNYEFKASPQLKVIKKNFVTVLNWLQHSLYIIKEIYQLWITYFI